jgi:hypothetical protein
MKLVFRLFIVLVVVGAIALLAGGKAAWAGSKVGSDPVSQKDVSNGPALDKPDPGSVKPPPAEVTICENGVKSVGGVATLDVTNLEEGYCIVASLRNHEFAVGHIPDGAGSALAHITLLRVYYHGKLISELPEEDGQSKICYAVPPGKTGQIYSFDFYGPHFGRPGTRDWVALDTTVTDGIACAAAQSTGAYALMGK